MELSQQQLTDILRLFESSPETGEVRQTARLSIRRNVTIVTEPNVDAGKKAVVLQDISRGGVRITYHEAFPRDRKFSLLLPSPAGGEIAVPCIVRHCEMVKQHLFRIGAQFDGPAGSP
ncbi:MAG TPA: PilZ domain-containing protein [Bryobacteraceae bacterium]|nr:PilZ domain-containing protein [Bryobacteraceae bacterium]